MYFVSCNPWLPRREVFTGSVETGEQVLSNQELVKTEFYKDFLKPNIWLHACRGVTNVEESTFSCVYTLRSPRKGAFTSHEIRLCSYLVPHLQTAARIYQRIADLAGCGKSNLGLGSYKIITYNYLMRGLDHQQSAMFSYLSPEQRVPSDLRSERLLMEELEYNLLFRWFVGLNMDEPVWNVTVFTKNRERLLKADIAKQFFGLVVEQAKALNLLASSCPLILPHNISTGFRSGAYPGSPSTVSQLRCCSRYAFISWLSVRR
jgi:hypothetical protein